MGKKDNGKFTINVGFITNSSSVVHYLPPELWNHPKIKALFELYGGDGYVGNYMASRVGCETVAVTPEQKEQALHEYRDVFESGFSLSSTEKETGAVIIFGDEYQSLPQLLSSMARDLASEEGIEDGWAFDFN